MDFEERLQKAVERGHRRGLGHREEALARAMGEDELKRLHGQYRLDLSEHIEKCLQHLLQHFPGFQCETIYGDRGWGAACSRDDFRVEGRGRRHNDYSRLEMTVRPFNTSHVLEVGAKGTIRNKEVFSRTYFEKIQEADPAKFVELIDLWVLEYAELYAART